MVGNFDQSLRSSLAGWNCRSAGAAMASTLKAAPQGSSTRAQADVASVANASLALKIFKRDRMCL